MGINRPCHRYYIRPADNFAGRQSDPLRISVFDIVKNERSRRFDRRRLQKRQIAPLPRDDGQGPMKAFDMVLRYWNNFDRVRSLSNVLIPPLAERQGNNYLACTPPTTD